MAGEKEYGKNASFHSDTQLSAPFDRPFIWVTLLKPHHTHAHLAFASRLSFLANHHHMSKVPAGVNLEYGSKEFDRLEGLGTAELPYACFVLVGQ
jgi:hypothetical protein